MPLRGVQEQTMRKEKDWPKRKEKRGGQNISHRRSRLRRAHLEERSVKGRYVLVDEVPMPRVDTILAVRIGMIEGVWIEPVCGKLGAPAAPVAHHVPEVGRRSHTTGEPAGHSDYGNWCGCLSGGFWG